MASWLVFFAGTGFAVAVEVDAVRSDDLRAYAAVVTGKVTYLRDNQTWAVSSGEMVPVGKTINTGDDGYGHFRVAGGDTFDVFANSQVLFRANTGNPGDLLDVRSGRARIHLAPANRDLQQRIFTPTAIISTHGAAGISLAVDEEGTVRIDVTEGEVRVQHALLPRSEPVVVRAIDAILVRPNETVSRQVDRGSLYRYTVKIWSALTLGHSGHDGQPVEGNRFLNFEMVARSTSAPGAECPECPPLQ
jgi:ferric-dicitrate binding protein FerR (iron transport regulator)